MGDYGLSMEMTADEEAEYNAKMAEYYDYENYEENYISYGYNYDGYDDTAGTQAPTIHDCESGSHECDSNATCIPSGDKYSCVCNVGFDGNGKRCRDTDECKKELHDCHQNADCNNFDGGYSCSCKNGFSGDGKINCTKEAINPCAPGLNPCDPNALCRADGEKAECECKPGFKGNGKKCKDDDECRRKDLNDCSENATCSNTPGSYVCRCNDGFTGNGIICQGPTTTSTTSTTEQTTTTTTEKPTTRGNQFGGMDMANIDLGDYGIGESTDEIESAYAEKMAEYYDYDNYELNYADYGYDDYDTTQA